MLSPGTTSIFYIIIKSFSAILLKFKVASLCESVVFPFLKGLKLICYIAWDFFRLFTRLCGSAYLLFHFTYNVETFCNIYKEKEHFHFFPFFNVLLSSILEQFDVFFLVLLMTVISSSFYCKQTERNVFS